MGQKLETFVNDAVGNALAALPAWAASSLDERLGVLNRYAELLRARKEQIADLISTETGKPKWESLSEVDAMINKVGLSIEAQRKFRSEESKPAGDAMAITRYKPHGVAAVLGPFNMPGHLPNGHIVPALLAGNTVVFKPSEYTPRIAEAMVECLGAAGIRQVVNLAQGGREVGEALVSHRNIDAIYFTG